jgi:hypothetical protein
VFGRAGIVVALVASVLGGGRIPVSALPSTQCYNISGPWNTLQGGNRTLIFTFKQTGSAVTGTATDGAGLNGTFTGNVTGDHVDVIVTWNAKRADGSTLEGEYEATISHYTLTGTTHDVANPSSHTTWTSSHVDTRLCNGAPSNPEPPGPSSTAEEFWNFLQTLSDDHLLTDGAASGLLEKALKDGKATEDEFESKMGRDPDGFDIRALTIAAGLAQQKTASGASAYPSFVAVMPVLIRMTYHAHTDLDPQSRRNFMLASYRLIALLLRQDTAATQAGSS